MKLPNYKNYTTKALLESLDALETDLDQNLVMDGSGELGGVIYKSYEPHFEAIQKELNNRDDYQENESGMYGDVDDELPY